MLLESVPRSCSASTRDHGTKRHDPLHGPSERRTPAALVVPGRAFVQSAAPGSPDRGVIGEDVPDREDPQRRTRRPRWRRQDLAGRGAAVQRRARSPASAGSRTARPSATSTPRSSAATSRCRSRSRRSSSTDHKVNVHRRAGLRRLRRRRRRRAPGRRPRAVRRVRGRGRRGADRDRVEARRATRPAARDLRQQARPRARVVLAHARRAEGRSSAPASRRCSCRSARRPTLAGVIDLLNDVAVTYAGGVARRAPRARSPTRWRPRSTRCTTRSSRASSSATTTSWSATSATRRSTSPSSPRALADGHRVGDRVPGAVRQRDEAHRHRPAREVPRRGSARAGTRRRPAGRARVQDDRRPVRRAREPVQGAAGHGQARRRAHEQRASKADERMHQLFSMRGKEQDTVDEVAAGDIAAVAKLADTRTGDVLAAKGTTVEVDAARRRPSRVLAVAIHARVKGDEDKLANALHRLQDEDPVLRIERNPETHQTVLRGHGRDAPVDRDSRSSRASSASRSRPTTCSVAYRETISGTAEAEGKLKKQSGGHGQFAVAWLRVEPKERGARQRVRRRDRRRRDPPQLHPRGREGRRRDRGARRRARLPGRRREGHVLRRQAPPGRQLRDGVQDRGLDGPPRRAREGRARCCSSR